MTHGSRKKVSTMEARLKWLREHPELWEKAELVSLRHGEYRLFLAPNVHRNIANEMKKAGLFAPTTYALDIPVNRYVRILRSLR